VRYQVIAAAGHMVNLEQPAAVNALLTEFLDHLPVTTVAGPEG
jgi:pimeloyl-ACP methyl ester carboxylesterase